MAEAPETETLGEPIEAVEGKQSKGAANKKKNKWKTVTADFYQPKPYESDQGKGKAGVAGKGQTGKGIGKGGEDFGAKGGRGGKDRLPQQDEERPPRLAQEEPIKPPTSDTPPAEIDAPGARGGGGEGSPKRKPLGGKPRDAKGKGKGKQAAPRKGTGPGPLDSSHDVPMPTAQPQRTALALSSGQGAQQAVQQARQQTAMVQQMSQQMVVPQQFASFGGQGFSTGAPGGVVYQNAQAMPAMYAMPYYMPVQMAPAQMVKSPSAIYTTSPPYVPAGAALGTGQKLYEPPVADGDRAALRVRVQQQIEYYFDIENLAKDLFLRRNMTDEGWVPLMLIAGFRLVKSMTTDMSLIVEAIRASNRIELDIQMQFIRLKDSWQQWVIGSAGAGPQHDLPANNLLGPAGAP